MVTIPNAYCYAVILNNEIDLKTVSPTRRAAIVNWLVVNMLCPIYTTTTDAQVEQMWSDLASGAFVADVMVSPSETLGDVLGKALDKAG